MSRREWLSRLLSGIEWKWSLWNLVYGVLFAGSFALPAWAVSSAKILQNYAPFSWVIAGFAGVFSIALSLLLVSVARRQWHRTSFDQVFRKSHPAINPLDETFSNTRIFLNDFVLPSDTQIKNKTFIDCEIVGPANIYLHANNYLKETHNSTLIDAVRLEPNPVIYNAFSFENCVFRRCSFHKITLFVQDYEFENFRGWEILNWISHGSNYERLLPFEGEQPSDSADIDAEDATTTGA